jgi:hypothetical protein
VLVSVALTGAAAAWSSRAAWTWAVGLRPLSALAPVPPTVPAAMVE